MHDKDLELLLKISKSLIDKKELLEAEEILNLILDQKEIKEVYQLLGEIYLKRDRPVEAAVFLEKFARVSENGIQTSEPDSFQNKKFSNKIDLSKIFLHAENYAIIKMTEFFPNYYDFSDIDILCRDKKDFLNFLIDRIKPYGENGFKIKINEHENHIHLDLFEPGEERLNIRFDLFEEILFKKFDVVQGYSNVLLATTIKKNINGTEVKVPEEKHDLALRFLEFIEYKDERPDKIKHLNYIKKKNSFEFIDVINRYTTIKIIPDKKGNYNVNFIKKDREEKNSEDLFYKVSPTCQIPKLNVLYQEYFGIKNNGCFVEVGAFDGEYVSNTSGLADLGWKGFYIEPVPEFAEKCKRRHKKNKNIEIIQTAIGADSEILTLNIGGPLSTARNDIKNNFEKLNWAKDIFKGESIEVPQLTLNQFLKEKEVKPNFELLVVDVEGYEWNVFKNFDIEKYHPQMVIVELHDQNDDYLIIREECQLLVKYFDDHGYIPIYKDKTNTIYIREGISKNKIFRFDYFMIWGHGLVYQNEILNIIRSYEEIELIAIYKKKINDLEKFVQRIYECDTVPFEHLKNKTKYLLATPPEILFILVKNHNPQEKYFGKGAFRHIQSQLIKDIKEEIRDRFNPKADKQRTEHHVIHASDYESQVIHVLKVLNLPSLEYFNRQVNKDFDLPFHIEPFDEYKITEINLDQLVASLVEKPSIPIEKTPHFQYLNGEKKDYLQYHEKYLGTKLIDDHFPESFDKLVKNFNYGAGKNGKQGLILARKEGNKYRILDGLHRAAILKYKGMKRVKILEPIYKKERIDSKISIVIFSKNRALQLGALLESFYLNCTDITENNLIVIYKAELENYLVQYQQLIKEYPGITFVLEKDFKSDLLNAAKDSKYLFFLVDDNIFVRNFSISHLTKKLDEVPSALGISLRLGENTTYCYPKKQSQKVPTFEKIDYDIFVFDWTTAEYDFNYPLEVSSSIYRTEEILPVLLKANYKNPNTLEFILNELKNFYKKERPLLLCPAKSISFCVPANIVQEDIPNRYSGDFSYSVNTLASLFDEGKRIDIKKLQSFIPYACHQEINFEFIQKEKQFNINVNNSKPEVSIYTVAYNAERYISKTIDSVLSQSFKNFEYIIVDDGSTDKTAELIELTKDNRINFHRREHSNFASGMNEAIKSAKGEFVLGVDSDDFISVNYLENILTYAGENPGYDYYYPSKLVHIDEQNNPLGTWFQYEGLDSDEIIIKLFKLASSPVPNPGSLKRKALFDTVGLYKPLGTIEDFVYLSENAKQIKFKLVPGLEGYFYRKLPSSNSNKFELRNMIMAEALWNMTKKYPVTSLFKEINFSKNIFIRRAETYKTLIEYFARLALMNKDRGGGYYLDIIKRIKKEIERKSQYA